MITNKRQNQRTSVNLPIQLNVGTQVSFQGYVKDLSLMSAFVKTSNKVYLKAHEELSFSIKRGNSDENSINGQARVSRIAEGEGIAIYFTQMDQASTDQLRQLIAR